MYSYSFQGQERDDEVKGEGNSYDFGARMMDPRLGRFLSLDPKASEYPFMSPYCFAANSPVRYIDINGEGPGDPLKEEEVLSYFDSDQSVVSYSITIYSAQPNPNSEEILNGLNFGHSFVGITAEFEDGSTKTLYAGLYADEDAGVNPLLGVDSGAGVIYDDGNSKANASKTKILDEEGAFKVLKYIGASTRGAWEDKTVYVRKTVKYNSRILNLRSIQLDYLDSYLDKNQKVQSNSPLIVNKLGKEITMDGVRSIIEQQKHLFTEKSLTISKIRQSVIANWLNIYNIPLEDAQRHNYTNTKKPQRMLRLIDFYKVCLSNKV